MHLILLTVNPISTPNKIVATNNQQNNKKKKKHWLWLYAGFVYLSLLSFFFLFVLPRMSRFLRHDIGLRLLTLKIFSPEKRKTIPIPFLFFSFLKSSPKLNAFSFTLSVFGYVQSKMVRENTFASWESNS